MVTVLYYQHLILSDTTHLAGYHADTQVPEPVPFTVKASNNSTPLPGIMQLYITKEFKAPPSYSNPATAPPTNSPVLPGQNYYS